MESEKVDNDRRLIEVSVVDHNSKHDFNVYPRIIQRGGEVPDTLNSVSKAIKSFYREPLIRTSLTNTYYEAIKTCFEGFLIAALGSVDPGGPLFSMTNT